jgi:hypothetical protein
MDVKLYRSYAGVPEMHEELLPSHARVSIDPDVLPQARSDWGFVIGAIDTAVEQGRPIDSELIRDIACRRQEKAAAEYRYVDRPGAGATLASSTHIVESIVELYLLGTTVSSDE